MFRINHHLPTFIRELNKGSSIRVFLNGDFYVENYLQKGTRFVFKLENCRLIEAAEALIVQFIELESISVRFSNDRIQEVNFQLFIEAGKLLLEKMHLCNSRKGLQVRARLERAIVALLYRLESENGGLDPKVPDEEQYHSLVHTAGVWKSTQQIFPKKCLSAKDKKQLKDAARYPCFTKLVLKNEELAENFFLWALRDQIAVRPFIEFPHHQWKMNRYRLNGRLSRLGGCDLVIQKIPQEQGTEKVLTLPFEGKPVNILDEGRSVLFRGNYILTIGEIFEAFDYKRIDAGNIEYMEDGIINWSTSHWGYWDADLQDYARIDFNEDNWWKNLPVLDRLSLHEARRKFGNHLTGTEWNFSLVSSRESQDLDFANSHAYASISVPQMDGSYILYTLGKFTFIFPETPSQALMNIGETAEATIAYPDENAFYTHRRHIEYSYGINEQEGRRFFESVKKDMLLSKEGNFIYQIESENCAKWAYEKLVDSVGRHRVPEIYTIPFLNSEPHGRMEKVFKLLNALPKKWQVPVTTFIHLFLGSYKGRLIIEKGRAVWKSLTHHAFWGDTVIYHPSMLYKQKEEGNIGRFVPVGVTLVGKAALSFVIEGYCAFKKYINHLYSVIYNFIGRELFANRDLLFLEFHEFELTQNLVDQQLNAKHS